jgi:hypothetical protein
MSRDAGDPKAAYSLSACVKNTYLSTLLEHQKQTSQIRRLLSLVTVGALETQSLRGSIVSHFPPFHSTLDSIFGGIL